MRRHLFPSSSPLTPHTSGQTSECWLRLLDKNRDAALASLQRAYGDEEGAKWFQRWRLFYIAVAEFFALKDGNEWMVMHYLFEKQSK